MERFIKYKRIEKMVENEEELTIFFDDLIIDGYEIIYYNEEIIANHSFNLNVIVVVGKKQSNII